VTVKLRLRIQNAVGCKPLSGYALYLWHCDRSGNYSLYSAPKESYLRGVQVSNARGVVLFRTIFPACYSGRYPHMHIEVFKSLGDATNGRNAVLTTQLAMPADACSDVYNNAKGYSASIANFANVSLKSDNVFGDDTAAELAAMTPTMTGDHQSGYSALATVALSV
jgi:protocatechuate 3,4-dioxygenase beta subunit